MQKNLSLPCIPHKTKKKRRRYKKVIRDGKEVLLVTKRRRKIVPSQPAAVKSGGPMQSKVKVSPEPANIKATTTTAATTTDSGPKTTVKPVIRYCDSIEELSKGGNRSSLIRELKPVINEQKTFTQLYAEYEKMPNYYKIQKGGLWRPPLCKPLKRLLVMIPMRRREMNLINMLPYLIKNLQAQLYQFRIFVVEQEGVTGSEWNKGKVWNSGILEMYKEIDIDDWDCIIYHDVDQILIDQRLSYACDPENPVFLAQKKWVWNEKRNMTTLRQQSFGAVATSTIDMLNIVNGFSNEFWGWGGEDDDILRRFNAMGYEKIKRQTNTHENWFDISHGITKLEENNLDHPAERIFYSHSAADRITSDGFNSLTSCFISRKVTPLFVHYKFDLGWNRDKPDPVNWPKCSAEDSKRKPDDDLEAYFRNFKEPTHIPTTAKPKAGGAKAGGAKAGKVAAKKSAGQD